MKKVLKNLVLGCIAFICFTTNITTAKAQTSSLNGKEYIYIPYDFGSYTCDNFGGSTLYIYSKNTNNVNIQFFIENGVINYDTSFMMLSNSVISFQPNTNNGSLSSGIIHITTSDSIFIFDSKEFSNPMFEFGSVIPKNHKGNKYIIPGRYNSTESSFLVSAINDNTNIILNSTANSNDGLITANIPYPITLQGTEFLSVGNSDFNSISFTWDTLEINEYRGGSIIQSENCNKFSIYNSCNWISSYPYQFGSNPLVSPICAQIRATTNNTGNQNDTTFFSQVLSLSVEDLFPVNTMGRKYICSPPPNGCEIVTFTAPYNNTIIRINGAIWDTLNSGESRVKLFTEQAYIEGLHPMSATISHSFMRDNTGWFWGGAGFIQLPALEQTATSGWFFYPSLKFIPTASNTNNYFDSTYFANEKPFIVVVTPSLGVNQTVLNNINIGSLFQPLAGNPQYSVARIAISTGFNEISNPNGLIVWSTSYQTKFSSLNDWGHANYQCYGAPLVMSFNKPTYEGKINTTPIENTLIQPYTICVGTPLQYTVGTNADSNLLNTWEFGDGGLTVSDTVFHTYADTGYYHVNLFVNSYCDTIKGLVHVVAPPVIALGNDTTLCPESSLLLDASVSGNATYLWSTGSTSPQITVSDTGTYHVTATTDVGCLGSDTIHISMFAPMNLNLGNDTILCYLAHILLDATQPFETHANYFWQDQSTNSTYTVINQGQYWVVVTNLCTQKRDTINIYNLMNPTLYLGNDTTICMNHPLLLNASIPWGITYQWENGSTNPTRLVENEGTYWVEASNPCVSVSDTIFVKVNDCDPMLIMPNVYTPNSDGTNDLFKAGAIRNITSLHLMIFNRWGENIFQSTNLNFAWDGQLKNQKCPEGVYFWVIQYVDINGNTHDLTGTVTLYR